MHANEEKKYLKKQAIVSKKIIHYTNNMPQPHTQAQDIHLASCKDTLV